MNHVRSSLLIQFLIVICFACASVKSPEGGPKDTERPELMESTPKSGASNFSETNLKLEFSEPVVEHNTKTQFLSPILPTTTVSTGKKLKIVIDSSLKLNTTYILNLSNKIKDEHEGNLLKDTSIIFTTGSAIDTGTITFQIQNLSGLPAQGNYTALAKTEQDITYWSKSDSLQPLTIGGLKNQDYKIEIFQDKNENLIYDQEDGRLFFETTVPSKEIKPIKLLPQKFKPIKLFWLRKSDTCVVEADERIIPDPNIEAKIIASNKEQTIFWLHPFNKNVNFQYADSIGNCYTDTLELNNIDSTRTLKMVQQINNLECTKIGSEFEMIWRSNWGIKSIKDSISFTQDSIWKKEKLIESARNHVKFKTKSIFAGKIVLHLDSLILFNQEIINYDTLQISKSDLDPAGNISGVLENVEDKEIILEITDAKMNIVGKTKGKKFSFWLKPGKYKIQVFEDLNKDGKYTGGNIKQNRKAEPLFYYPNLLDLKPGWDLENIQVKVEF